MYLIDTTVWIDFFRHGNDEIKQIIKNNEFYTNNLIIMEFLQGVKNDTEHDRLKNWFLNNPSIELTRETYLYASDIYRDCRKNGLTIRKTIDCIIASSAIKNDLILISNDSDFELIEKCTKLKYKKLTCNI